MSEWSQATIFDARGRTSANDFDSAYVDWETDPHPVGSVICRYLAEPVDGLSAQFIVTAMGSTEPQVEVTVSGPDAAEARGVALEARDKGERGTLTTTVSPPELPVTPPRPEPPAMSAVDAVAETVRARKAAEARSVAKHADPGAPGVEPRRSVLARIGAFLNHGWVQGICVSVISGAILIYLFR